MKSEKIAMDTFVNRLGHIFTRQIRLGMSDETSTSRLDGGAPNKGPREYSHSEYRQLKTGRFESVLNGQPLDASLLRERLWSGCSNCEYHIREVVWKVVLGYLPTRLDRHTDVHRRKRLEYTYLSDTCKEDLARLNSGCALSESIMASFHQIKIDIPRTCSYSIELFKDDILVTLMLRVLYIWALRNPACSYVQGMNDMVVPTLIVLLEGKFRVDILELNAAALISVDLFDVEADLYWILSKLLQDLQDHYTVSQPGIQRMVQKLKDIIQRVDIELFDHLHSEQVDFMQISFRWFNCLFTREFKHECVLRLWDTCIAEVDGFTVFLIYFSAALLIRYSPELKGNDFQHIVTLLNNSENSRSKFDMNAFESLLSEAFVLKSLFHSSPHHLQSSSTPGLP